MGVIERRKREKDVRRELAIDAAMSIYEEEGYHAITMEKIAERSELSRAALYLYFKNKDEIVISAVLTHADYFARVLQEVYDQRESIKEKLLEKLWECFQRFYEKDPVVFTAWQLFHQSEMIGNLAPELRDVLHESGSKVVALQHKIVEYAVTEQIFIQCDYRALSEVIWSTFLGIVYVERSKNVLSHKSHMIITQDLARKILARGVLNPSRKKITSLVAGNMGLVNEMYLEKSQPEKKISRKNDHDINNIKEV
jgi:TetR/AcrR family transcriptional regulator